MKNKIFYRLKSKVIIQVEGKNLERFIKRLSSKGIELLHIRYPKPHLVELQIYQEDYQKVLEVKSIYEVSVVGYGGILKIRKKIRFHRFLLLALLIGMGILLFLTNVIFKIEIVHTNIEIRKLLLRELEEYGIKEKSMRKNFQELENIKKQILEKHKDKIEWLEIENVGTKYVIRLELRKIPELNQTGEKRHIIAKKDAIIREVEAESGEIIRGTNDYVRAGDVVISGNITLNEETKDTVRAEGKVYGEVWYQTTVEYPLHYREERETGKTKTVYTIHFLNKEIGLFDFSPFADKKREVTTLLKHPLLPFTFEKQKQKEVDIIDEELTEEKAITKAEELAREKMMSQLNDNEYIITQKNLNISKSDSKMVVEVFFTVYEDITDYTPIVEITEPGGDGEHVS